MLAKKKTSNEIREVKLGRNSRGNTFSKTTRESERSECHIFYFSVLTYEHFFFLSQGLKFVVHVDVDADCVHPNIFFQPREQRCFLLFMICAIGNGNEECIDECTNTHTEHCEGVCVCTL